MGLPINRENNITDYEILNSQVEFFQNNIKDNPVNKINELHRNAMLLLANVLQDASHTELKSKVLDLESRVANLYISKLSSLSDQIHASETLIELVDLQDQVINIFNHLTLSTNEDKKLLNFANKILKEIEQKQLARVLSGPENLTAPISQKEVLQLMLKHGLTIQKDFFDKLFLVNPDSSLSSEDFTYIQQLEEIIERRLSVVSDPIQNNELVQIKRNISDIKFEMISDIKSKLLIISQFTSIVDLYDDMVEAETDSEYKSLKKELSRQCHDFYWDFHTPQSLPVNFESLIDIVNQHSDLFPSDENGRQLLQLFSKDHSIVQKYGVDDIPSILSFEEYRLHKNDYLKDKRDQAVAKLSAEGAKPQRVVIAGGGPAGLMRGLIAALNGHDVRVIEKRSDYSRDNVIKLTDHRFMQYFGISDSLIVKGKIYPPEKLGTESSFAIALKHLESELADLLEELFPGVLHTGKELIDIREGAIEGKTETGALFKNNEGISEWHPADVIVDAAGGREISSKRIGGERLPFSEHKIRIAVAIRTTTPNYDQYGPLATPQMEYAILEPKKHDELRQYFEDSKSLSEEHQALSKAIQSLSDEKLSKYMKSVFEDKLARRLRVDVHHPDLMHLGKLHLEKLQRKINEAKSNYEVLLREEIESYFNENPFMFPNVNPNLDYDQDIAFAGAFHVHVSLGMPTRKVGGADIVKSGDSVVTPDPFAATGAKTAIKGGPMFARYLNTRSLQPHKALHQLDFGISRLNDEVVHGSLTVRHGEKTSQRACIVALREHGALTEQEAMFLDLCLFKVAEGIDLSEQDRIIAEPIVQRAKSNRQYLVELTGSSNREFFGFLDSLV